MPLTLEQFSAQLIGGNLLPAEDVARLREQHQPADAEQFARLLVRQKLLTAYQAQQAYAGRGSGLVLGNYVLLDKLGQGGMGMVLKARHRRMNRIVALKILSPAVTKTPEAMKRFQREVEAAARLHHPNIVTAHDADEVKGTHFLVMEYVEGTDLSALVKKKGPLPVDQAINCVTQAARGLEFAHKHGIVHRDIKPANLLLDDSGTVKILDMGLARIEGETGSQAELTSTGAVMGTVDYMAPEQALNTKGADARSDIYSLGVTLWYLLTGRPVYEGDSLMARLIGHRESPIPSLKGVRGEVPSALDDLFRRMIAKQPQDRFQSMTEVLAALEACRGGSSSGSTPSFSLAPSEESKLSEFMEVFGGSTDPTAPTRTSKSPGRTATAVTTAPPAGSEYEATVTSASPSEGTDPQTLITLSKGKTRPAAVDSGSKRPSRLLAWALAVAGAAVVLIGAVALSRPGPKEPATPAASVQGPPAPVKEDPPSGSLTLAFDGSGSVQCPPLEIPGRELTVEAWVVTPDTTLTDSRPLWQLADSSVTLGYIGRCWGIDFYRTDRRWEGVTNGRVATLGGLTHVAATISAEECRFFLNGRLQSAKRSPDVMGDVDLFWSQLRSAPFIIGSRKMTPEGPRRFWVGEIRQVRASSNIRYREHFLPPPQLDPDTHTLALYRCDEGEGDILRDSSGRGRHGKIVGAKWVPPSAPPEPQVTEGDKAMASASGTRNGSSAPSVRTPLPPRNPNAALRFSMGRQTDYVELPPEIQFDERQPGTIEVWILDRALETGTPFFLVGDRKFIKFQFDEPNRSRLVIVLDVLEGEPSRSLQITVPTVDLRPGPLHLAACWNGQGSFRLYANGKRFGSAKSSQFQYRPYPGSTIGFRGNAGFDTNLPQAFTLGQVRISRTDRYTASFIPERDLQPDAETIALYRFDEGEGEVIHDASGNGHDGKLGGATWVARPDMSPTFLDGATALRFDGVDDRIDLPQIPLTDATELTIDAVVELQAPINFQGAIFRTCQASMKIGNGLESYFSIGRRSGDPVVTTHSTELPMGRPVHLAGVWNGKRTELYVDGQLQGWNEDGDQVLLRRGSNTIGDHTSTPGEPFAGKIYGLRITKKALYNGPFRSNLELPPTPETVALYRFDEGTGNVLKDSSGNDLHGTIVGPVWVGPSGVPGAGPQANPAPPPGTDTTARLNSAGQDDAYPWLLPGALKVYYTREAAGLESAIYSAVRNSADEPFGTPRREMPGRMLVVTADDLYGVLLPGNYEAGKPLVETSRTSASAPWGDPRPIASFAASTNAKSPWISDDGLTLVFQRPKTTSPIAASSTEFVISRRPSRSEAWGTPELLPMSPAPAIDDLLTWPQLSPDQRTLCFCLGGTRLPRVFFATRTGPDGPFENYQPVTVNGQPLTGRAPRWVPDRSELILSRDADPAVKDSDLQVVRGIHPRD